MKKVNAQFFGESVTNNGYGKLASLFDTKDNKLSAFANHAAFEYIVNGDRDFLDRLFQCERLLLKSGELNAEGKAVAGYIKHFSPITVSWKKEAKALVISKTDNKKLKHCFFTGETVNDKRETVIAAEAPQWPLTMGQLKRQKDNAPKKESAPSAASPKALKTRVEKIAEALETVTANKVAGADLADLQNALLEASAQVSKLLEQNVQFSREQNAAIDGDKLHEMNGTSSKAKGAGTRADTDRAKHAANA